MSSVRTDPGGRRRDPRNGSAESYSRQRTRPSPSADYRAEPQYRASARPVVRGDRSVATLGRPDVQRGRRASAVYGDGVRRPHTGRVVVLIPAHNEAPSIGQTLRSLRRQTRLPDNVIVVCDNCTDETAAISAAHGARVMSTAGNSAKKAGALNQALEVILPRMSRDDMILAMDADSQLSQDWIRSAAEMLHMYPRVGGVCGAFLGEAGYGILGQFQRNEFYRYARHINRRSQTPVLSGTGTLFRVRALREIARERGLILPGIPGDCYNTESITEDNEMTLALKSIGYRCWSAPGTRTLTEVMPTWRDLFRQRLRWQRGALGDLRRYGLTKVTAGYWLKQILIYLAFVCSIMCWLIMGISMRHHVGFNLSWTVGILSVTLIERVLTVRKAGFLGTLIAALIVPEFIYDIFRLTFFARALYDFALNRDVQWNHVVKGNA
jgi:poly-beta-1,6-N-acetyl-D-glucosamine synthase